MRKLTLVITVLLFLLMSRPVGANEPLPEGGQAYTVQAGDYLSKLAEKFYGDMQAWPAIWLGTWEKAVEDDGFAEIDDPDFIEVGQMLWIPDQVEAERIMTKMGHFCQGWAYFEDGEYEQALAEFDKVIELYPHDPEAYISRAYFLSELGEYERAITDLDRAIELNPDNAWAYNSRGVAHKKLGEYEQAIVDYSKAIELEPNYIKAHRNRGLVYNELGEYEQALADYNKAIELNPDNAWAYNSRGFNYSDMGQYEQAIADYNQALKLGPDDEHVDYLYNNRGFAYGSLGQYDLAWADFERVEALNPDNAWLYYYRAVIYIKMGETDKARSELELSLQLDDPPLDEKRKARAEALLE